jgi:anti-sigma factor RsiW
VAEHDQPVTDDELFAYATGELDGPARARVEGLVRADTALRARLAWYEAVCDGVAQTLPPLEDLPSAETILARVRAQPRRGGFLAWLTGPALKPAAAFAALLIVAQGAVIGVLLVWLVRG